MSIANNDSKSNSEVPPDTMLERFREVIREELRAKRRREVAPDPLLTKADAAEVLNCSARTVDTLIASGELASVKVRRSRRIPPSALKAYVARQARGSE